MPAARPRRRRPHPAGDARIVTAGVAGAGFLGLVAGMAINGLVAKPSAAASAPTTDIGSAIHSTDPGIDPANLPSTTDPAPATPDPTRTTPTTRSGHSRSRQPGSSSPVTSVAPATAPTTPPTAPPTTRVRHRPPRTLPPMTVSSGS